MQHKLINTGDYLLIVDDSEIKNYYYDFFISKLKHSNGAEYAKSDIAKQVIAHLPLNNSPILEGVDLLPPLKDEVEKLVDEYKQIGKDAGLSHREYTLESIAFKNGYNKAKEKYKYTEEDIIKAILFGMQKGLNVGKVDETDNDWVNNYVKSLQQLKIPVGFKCEIEYIGFQEEGDLEVPKSFVNSQGLTQWVGEYVY